MFNEQGKVFIHLSVFLEMVEIKANPGDYVKLKLSKFREVEGNVLESYDKNILLLKLRSGYNIGILKEKIVGVKVLRKFKEVKKESKVPFAKGKKSIGLVVTGGTIASKLDSKTGGVKALTEVGELARFYSRLFEKVNVKKLEVPFMELSENMSWNHWKKIGECVENMLGDPEIEGVVVTHGSDFLHYTSSALSFMLRDLNKPVVLTFSQRSIDRGSSDAEMNLNCAVEMALSDVAEVMVVGHASESDDFCFALGGTKVRKMHTSRRDTFKAINVRPIARVFPDGKIEKLKEYRPRNKENVILDSVFSSKVALVKFYPGQAPDILDYYLEKGYKGIVIEMSGLGHVSENWISRIKKLVKKGVVVCGAAQTIYGRLNGKVYSTGRELEKVGVIYLKDMLAETAFVKLGWVLGHRKWRGKAGKIMLEDFAGEFNEVLNF